MTTLAYDTSARHSAQRRIHDEYRTIIGYNLVWKLLFLPFCSVISAILAHSRNVTSVLISERSPTRVPISVVARSCRGPKNQWKLVPNRFHTETGSVRVENWRPCYSILCKHQKYLGSLTNRIVYGRTSFEHIQIWVNGRFVTSDVSKFQVSD